MSRVLCQKVKNSLCNLGGSKSKTIFTQEMCKFISVPIITVTDNAESINLAISKPAATSRLGIAKYHIMTDAGQYIEVLGESGSATLDKTVRKVIIRAEDRLGNMSPVLVCEVGSGN